MIKFSQVSFFIVVVGLFFCSRQAPADDTKNALVPDVFVLDEIVVTATKTPEKRRDIPNAVIVIDAKQIEESGATTIGELAGNETGIELQSYGDYAGAAEEIHVRGMRGNATQVFVNGVDMTSPSLGLTDVGKIPLRNIERIEIVKGGGSLLYGSGANTVNIITKRPAREAIIFKAGAGYGTHNTYRAFAENGAFITDSVGFYLTAGTTETDGFRQNSHFRQHDASMKWLFNKADFDVSLTGNFIDRSFGIPGVKPPEGTASYSIGGVRFYDSETATLLDNGGDEDRQWALEVKGVPLAWLDYNLKMYCTRLKNRYYERYAFDGSGSESLTKNEMRGVAGHVDIYPFKGAKLLAGGEYKDMDWSLNNAPLDINGNPTSTSTTKAHLYTGGIFTEGEYRPTSYLKAVAGIRQERHSTFGTENIPLLGLVLNPSPSTSLKFHYGKHFMAPTFNDLFWPEDPYTKGNPHLKPEAGHNLNVTAEQTLLNNKIFLALSYFHWNIDDKIQWEPDSNGVFSPLNLAGYKADGFEAQTKIGPFFNVVLSLSYTYLDAEEESRDYSVMDYGIPDFRYSIVKREATYTPEHSFKGALTYRNGSGLTATVIARYTSDMVRYRPETTAYPSVRTVVYTLDPHWTADIDVKQRLFKHWILSLTGRNIFNTVYDTNLGLFTDQNTYRTTMCGYPGAGRSFFAAVSYEF